MAEASVCQRCSRMGSPAVLSERNGPVDARVMFVAEAPGRLGAGRTGIPLSGDQSGRNFERLLGAARLSREDVFVTNAVLCNPLDEAGRNASPTRAELRRCVGYLERTIRLIEPVVVVTLGAVALEALNQISPHSATLRYDVGVETAWAGRLLVPMYHPSPRAQIHRSFANQAEDFARLGDVVRAVTVG